MRKSVLFVTVVLMGLIWVSLLIADDEMCVPMGEITLSSLAKDAERSAVTFPHAVHFNYTCQECHHKWNGKEAIQSCTTSGCHDLDKAPVDEKGKPIEDKVIKARYYKNAFHDNCIGCHKQIKMKNKDMEASMASLGEKLPPTGPTGCIECHPKE
jgi:nitrate/TMAO reductase-like tetraheme cytochrome c subunit